MVTLKVDEETNLQDKHPQDGMLVHCRVSYPFIHLGGERPSESKESWLSKQHNDAT